MISQGASESEKLGYYRFSDNPQEENPSRGYIVSANHQPVSTSGLPIAGYYNLPDRAQALEDRLGNDNLQWNALNSQSRDSSGSRQLPRFDSWEMQYRTRLEKMP